MTSPRLRFAPSPTGFLHVGGGRTALYNWLFVRSHGGTLIVRSDDTDRERSTLEYADDIVSSLRWLGLDWDEGIEVGGPHGEYHQSRRLERYREVAHGLVEQGKAYYSFATPDQLEQFRNEAMKEGRSPAYDGRFRVPTEETQRRLAAGETVPIRFAVPRPGETAFHDVVREEVRFDHVQVDDFVILRSDGTPTYHLASTVDDVDFDITHVVRGEDLLASTPKHILLTHAMGHQPATYAHLPLLMGPDGAKLSKRHGHTSINTYRAEGYLPEAVLNFLAILSWSPGGEEEIVSLPEMVERFRLEAVSKNPATFDLAKLEWMNGVYIRELAPEDFVERAMPFVVDALGRELTEAERTTLAEIAPHIQERAKLLAEVGPQVTFLFTDVTYDEASWEKVMTKPESGLAVTAARESLAALPEWSTEGIEQTLRSMLATHELSARKGLQPLRVAVSGSSVSPPLFESMAALGREPTLTRLSDAAARIEAGA